MSDVVQNVKVRFIVEGQDLSTVDANLNKLTASELKLKDGLKQVDTQAKATNKTLQEETQKSAKAVTDSGKSFDDLSSKVKSLSSQIPGAFQVEQVLGFAKATTTASAGVGTMSSAMGVLKYAIAATGIGALVLAVGSLVAYFTRTDEGAAKLDGIFRAIGATVNILLKGVVALGESLFQAFENPKQAALDLVAFIKDSIIGVFKGVVTVLHAIGQAVIGNFSELQAIGDNIGNAFNSAVDKIKAFGSEIGKAAEEAYKLGLAFDDLEDREREFSITQANTSKLISQLIIQSKNRTLSEKERIAIIDQAGRLETDLLNKTLGLSKERLALIIRENQVSRDTGQLSDDQRQKEIDQINKITALETESALLQERLQNRRDLLIEQALTKELALIKKTITDEETIQKERYVNRSIGEEELQDNLAFIQLNGLKREREFLKANGKDITDINKSIEDILVKQRQDTDKKISENAKKAAQDLLDAKKKEYEEDYAFYTDLSKKKIQAEKDEADKIRQIKEKANQLAVTIANGFFQLQQQNLNNQLQQLQYNQSQELASVGSNEQAKAVINAKFAKETAEIKRKQAMADKEQAIFNIGISTASAVIKQAAATPLPGGFPLIALVAALGAAQLAFAVAKPIPKFYNKGTKGVPGLDTTRDSVHAMLTPGEGVMPVDRMKEYKPAFDAIFDRKIPADLINSIALNPSILNGKNGGNNESSERLLKSIDSKLDKIKTFEVNFDAKGFKKYLKGENSKTEIENNYARMK